MPLQLRTTTLTAAETSDGIRIYTKDVDGFARELCNSTTTSTLAEGVKANNKDVTSQSAGWFTGELAFPCSIDSALCSFAWASWSQSVFYQDATDVLRERRHLNSWETTNFVQQGAMRGTNIAAVHSSGAAQIVLFYQDKDGYIRYRTAKNLVWNKDSVPLVKAALGTGIGATAWNNLDEIRLYYQDEENVVREYRGNFDGKWSLTAFNKKYTHSIGDITAVSWSSGQATEIRLYIQDETNNITELCNGGNDWYIGEFKVAALPNADIIAFTRVFDKNRCTLHVIWAGQDQQLWQRVIVPGQGWLPPTAIASIRNAGDYAGGWVGEQFSDVDADIELKRLVKVRVRCGHIVDAVQVEFDDGSATAVHGGPGGGEHVFALGPGEDVIRVHCVSAREWIHCLKFETSFGRASEWYGLETAALPAASSFTSSEYATHVWYNEGRALAGFLGCTKSYVKGIKPIWSTRASKASLTRFADYLAEANRTEGELRALAGRLAATKGRAEHYKAALRALAGLGTRAMAGVETMAQSVEYLHDLGAAGDKAKLGHTARRAQDIARQTQTCRDESDVLEACFGELEAALVRVKPEGDEIRTDIKHILTEANARAGRVKDLSKWSEEYLNYKLVEKEALEIQKEDFERDLHKGTKEFTDKQIEIDVQRSRKPMPVAPYADRATDRSGQRLTKLENEAQELRIELVKTEQMLTDTQADIAATEDSVTGIVSVLARVAAFAEEVQRESGEINALVDESEALQAMADTYKALLAQIYVQSKDIDAGSQAKQFAAGLLEIIKLAMSAAYLKQLLTLKEDDLVNTMVEVAQCRY